LVCTLKENSVLRHIRSLVILALVFLLAACGEQSTGKAISAPAAAATTAASPTTVAVASTAPSAAPSAPATPTTAATATTAATTTTAATPTTAATATTGPKATAAASPTTARASASPTRSASSAAPSAAPQRTPTKPAASGGTLVTDSEKRCQMALPDGVTEDAPGSGELTIGDSKGFVLLQSIQGGNLDATVDAFVPSFTSIFTNYQETNRQKTADSERIDFTGEFILDVEGTMYFKQIDNIICNIVLFVYADSGVDSEAILGTMIGSLQLVKP
jgi:hypothetical protein